MPDHPKQFNDNFYQLPEEVQFYFGCPLIVAVIKEMQDEYGFDKESFYSLIFEVVNNNFDFSPVRSRLPELKINPLAEKQFLKDFVGKIFLPLAAYLDKAGIKKALIQRGGSEEEYREYVENFYELIEDENLSNIDILAEERDRLSRPSEERAVVLDIFANDLVDVLRIDAPESIRSLNSALIFLLYNLDTFRTEATNALLENKLNLTRGKISLEGRTLPPTVGNWLKDFIKTNGSDYFDEIVLAQYLGSSSNASHLSPEEREMLSKTLKLYRNLAFFPESLEDVPLNKWQIIPVTESSQGLVAPREEKVIELEPFAGLEDKPEPKDDSLEATLTAYKPGSLEYKAIKEEISRLKKKK